MKNSRYDDVVRGVLLTIAALEVCLAVLRVALPFALKWQGGRQSHTEDAGDEA